MWRQGLTFEGHRNALRSVYILASLCVSFAMCRMTECASETENLTEIDDVHLYHAVVLPALRMSGRILLQRGYHRNYVWGLVLAE